MNRVAFITGGSRGIGAAMISRFKHAGYRVVACARSSISAPEVDLALKCDVAEPAQVGEAVAAAVAAYGRLDCVINNAGQAGSNSMSPDASDELWHRIIDVNLHGTYYVCKQVLPHLPDRTGRIINIASVLALKGVPDQPAYCAAKHAVLGLTRSLAHRVAARGITVNAICPGWVATKMADGRMRDLAVSREDLEAGVPIGRMIEPEEVAELALYLAGPAAGGITGQALTIDGGALA